MKNCNVCKRPVPGDPPSGVCGEACLRKGQGFQPRPVMVETDWSLYELRCQEFEDLHLEGTDFDASHPDWDYVLDVFNKEAPGNGEIRRVWYSA